MRRDLAAAARALVLPTLVLIFSVGVVPGRLPLVVRLYALVLCGVVLVLSLLALRRAYPPASPLRPRAPSERGRRRPPPTLARLEDELALGVAGSFDLHYRLVPRMRSIADGLLASRHRLTIERDPEDARRLLGDEAWELVRPDRPVPDDRLARGVPRDTLARVVDSLERV